MSIKTNTTSLQNLLEQVNALPEVGSVELPEVENLDTEISTQSTLLLEQDAKIAELAQVLAGKASSSENNFKTAKITIQSSSRIISVVYTGIGENMTPTARYSYIGGGSTIITALQGTSIIVLVDSIVSTQTSGAVRILSRNTDQNIGGYILDPIVRCYHVLYNSGNAGLITIT